MDVNMLGIDVWVGITVIIGFVLSTISFLATQWYNMKQLIERVGDLETNEKEILKGYLTAESHLSMQRSCQKEIYRDMNALEGQIQSIHKRLEKSEEARDKCRAEDLQWKAEMQETMVEIRTIVKSRLYEANQ